MFLFIWLLTQKWVYAQKLVPYKKVFHQEERGERERERERARARERKKEENKRHGSCASTLLCVHTYPNYSLCPPFGQVFSHPFESELSFHVLFSFFELLGIGAFGSVLHHPVWLHLCLHLPSCFCSCTTAATVAVSTI